MNKQPVDSSPVKKSADDFSANSPFFRNFTLSDVDASANQAHQALEKPDSRTCGDTLELREERLSQKWLVNRPIKSSPSRTVGSGSGRGRLTLDRKSESGPHSALNSISVTSSGGQSVASAVSRKPTDIRSVSFALNRWRATRSRSARKLLNTIMATPRVIETRWQ